MKAKYLHKRFRRLICCAVCAMMLLASLPAAAISDPTPAPTVVPVPAGLDIIYARYSTNPELLLLKSKLFELGYYVAQVSESDLRSSMLDDFTMLALKEACRLNNLPYEDSGIVRSTWGEIMSGQLIDPRATATPGPTANPFHHIYWMEQSDAVARLQERLQSLGYGGNMTPGVYDENLRDALDLLLQINNNTYDQVQQNGITTGLQELILSNDDLIPFTTPSPTPTPEEIEETLTTGQKLRRYFTSKVNMFGLGVPMILIWLISLGLVVATVLLAIHFFVPSDNNSRRQGSSDETSREEGDALNGSGKIKFVIEYKGKSETHSYDIQRELKIGRNVGNFPLDMEDTHISRKHCIIYYSNRNLMLRDHSSNGTYVNGKLCLNGEHVLTSGDVLRVGHHTITLYF